MNMNSSPFVVVVVILLLSSATIFTVQAQGGNQACVSNLAPCASFMATTTKPPETCCGPLKTAITTQLDCLCGLYNTPGLLESFKINLTQALAIPARCGINDASLTECSKVGGSAPSPAGTLAPTGTPPSRAGKMTGFGVSGLWFLVSWVVMLL